MRHLIKNFNLAFSATVLTLSSLMFLSWPAVYAQNIVSLTWKPNGDCGTGGSCDWSDVNNWTTGVAPTNATDAYTLIFDNSTLTSDQSPYNDISQTVAVNEIDFIGNGNTAGYALSGNVINLGAGGVLDSTTGTPGTADVLNMPLSLTADQTFTSTDNFYGFDKELDLNGYTLTIDDTNSYGFIINDDTTSTGVSGSGALVINSPTSVSTAVQFNGKPGSNPVTGNTNSGFTGDITINAGTVIVGTDASNDDPFGSAWVTVSNGASMDLIANNGSGSPDISLGNPVTLSGTGVSNGGALQLTANSGTPTLNASGLLTLGASTTVATAGTIGFTDIACTNNSLALTSGSAGTLNGSPVACPASGGSASASSSNASSSSSGKTTKAPGVPDTGFSLVSANITAPLLGSTVAASFLYILSRKAKKTPSNH